MKKIRLTRAKGGYRHKGIGLTPIDQAMVLLLNEVVDEIRKLKK